MRVYVIGDLGPKSMINILRSLEVIQPKKRLGSTRPIGLFGGWVGGPHSCPHVIGHKSKAQNPSLDLCQGGGRDYPLEIWSMPNACLDSIGPQLAPFKPKTPVLMP